MHKLQKKIIYQMYEIEKLNSFAKKCMIAIVQWQLLYTSSCILVINEYITTIGSRHNIFTIRSEKINYLYCNQNT